MKGGRLAARVAAKLAAKQASAEADDASAATEAEPAAQKARALVALARRCDSRPPQVVVFPSQLSAAQRALVHELAGAAGVPHASSGEAEARRVAVGAGEEREEIAHSGGAVADATLARWLAVHCNLHVPAAAPAARKPAAPVLSVEAFCAKVAPLLELERNAEVEQSEQAHLSGVDAATRRGACLAGLRASDASPGFMGRTVVTLTLSRGEGAPLPAHRFGPHDVVAMRPSRAEPGSPPLARGVVCRLTESSIAVALDDAPDEGLDGLLRLDQLANEVTHERLKAALRALTAAAAASGGRGGLVDILFGVREPREPPSVLRSGIALLNSGLDASQVDAVKFALAAPEVALIHGPPGTGKTTALVELIAQCVARGERVLACAASNIAVDNLLERLRVAVPKVRAVRLGHPARLSPAVLECCLDAAVARADSSALAADVRKEMKTLSSRLLKLGPRDRAERRDVRRQLNQLGREERARNTAAVKEVLSAAQVVGCTLTGALSRTLETACRDAPFDVVVIDEAAQALETACWGALLKGKRAVLAGDHLQLPPTVVCEAAERGGLGRTLFERAHEMHPQLARMLTVQYRMHANIADWASGELYGNRLTAPPAVAARTLAGLSPGSASLADTPVLLLIDSAGCDMEEAAPEGGAAPDAAESKSNEGEARVALAHAERLVAAGVPAASIGVISPYSAQVALLREFRREAGEPLVALEISTVDGFQGREKEAIIISCVRSNARAEIGFLADARRMNVAVTRARRHCALVGDSETLAHNLFLKRLLAWFEEHGEVRSAAEYA